MMALLLGSVASSIMIDGGGGGDGGPLWSNTVFRADLETALSNLAHNGTPLTAFGAAARSSVQAKFGTYSLGVNTGGTDTGYVLCENGDESQYFGNKDFTVSLWVYLSATWTSFYRAPIGDFAGGRKGSWCIFIGDSTTSPAHRPMLYIDGPANPVLTSSASLPIAQWAHLVVCRNGTTLRLFMDGVMRAKATIAAGQIIGGNMFGLMPGVIGGNGVGASDRWRGYIDDIRIVQGVAEYTTDTSFAPPTTAMPTTGTPSWAAPPAPTSLATVGALTAKAGWGTIKRNPAYSGPALRVANLNTADEIDVAFDANGYVTGARPYGDATRVVKVYDQWGTDDMVCAKTAGFKIAREDWKYKTWRIRGTGVAGMQSTKTVSAAAWNSTSILWAAMVSRPFNTLLRSVMLVEPAAGSYMGIGTWINATRVHWRINGGAAQDWVNTDIVNNNDKCGGEMERMIGDMTLGSGTAYGYHNGTLNVTYGYSYPLALLSTGKVNWMGGGPISNAIIGHATELHLFNGTAAATAGDIAAIDAAMAQALR